MTGEGSQPVADRRNVLARLDQCARLSLALAKRRLTQRACKQTLRAGVIAIGATLAHSYATPAQAFDFFGLFGSSDKPPDIVPDALSYAIEIEVAGQDPADKTDVKQALRDASTLYKLRQDRPVDGEALFRRAQLDLGPALDALWALGYYDARLTVTIAGANVDTSDTGLRAASNAAEAYRNRGAVPVRVVAQTGPLYKLRNVDIAFPRAAAPEGLPRRSVTIRPGDPARSADVRAQQSLAVDYFRDQSRPLAKPGDLSAVVDHRTQAMDVVVPVTPGPLAGIGTISINGTQDVDPRVIASFVYLERGESYSRKKITDARKAIAAIPALGSVRIRESETLDADGNLPLFVDVTERKPRLIGFSARYSTMDGPGVRAYWEHRNLFGGAERLRIEGDVVLAPRIDGTEIKRLRDFTLNDLGTRLSISFEKPALGGSRNDLLVDAFGVRERVGDNRFGGYTNRAGGATLAVRHRFSDTFSIQGGVTGERASSSDVLGRVDATMIGPTAGVRYDSTDNLLDPKSGIRFTATVTGYPTGLGSTVNFVEARATGSAYYSLDEDQRYVLAGRLGFGALGGADISEIPAGHRFFAGGGGSVRGYAFRSVSPLVNGSIVGGSSLVEGSAEARIRITDTIGLVPFVDVGKVSASSLPSLKGFTAVGAGLGLRYLTAIGPIRLDVATPVNRRDRDRPIAVYVSIGQAF